MTQKIAQLKCLFFGSLSNLAVMGRVAAFVESGFEVFLINVTFENPLSKAYPVPVARIVDDWFEWQIDPYDKRFKSRSKRIKCNLSEHLRNYDMIPEAGQMKKRLQQVVFSVKPDFVVLHYGTIAIHYARLLKRVMPQLPLINIINVVPVSMISQNSDLTYKAIGLKWQMLIELSNYRRWLPQIDGVIYSSREMQDYALKEFGTLGVKSEIIPDFLPVSFQIRCGNSKDRRGKIDDNPSVIFLGAAERWGEQLDDIDKEFMQIANERIHIYSVVISDEVVSTGFGHRFKPFNVEDIFAGRLADFAAQFDAAIITYNFDVSQKNDRFRSNLPTRFFTAISACMPIAVSCGKMAACEKFVSDNGIGFSYKNAADLRRQLLDQEKLAKYRMRAIDCAKKMNSEAQGEDIYRFVKTVIKHSD